MLSQIKHRQPIVDDQFQQDLPQLVKTVLRHRGIGCDADLSEDLSLLPDPLTLPDVETALARLTHALFEQQRIMVVGDFDVDGATSTTLVLLVLSELGFTDVRFAVPDRFEQGYGLSEAIVEEVALQQPDLIITVDNGVSSLAGVNKANQLGIDVIITDHHLPSEQLPAAAAIVNPNHPRSQFACKNLAGVGVAFFLLLALRTRLRELRYFTENKITEPNMAKFLDLVALGTVCDLVPLDRVNQVLVNQGIKRIRRGLMRPGIDALLTVSRKDASLLCSSDMGFVLGPKINAAGRLDDMSQGIALLLTSSQTLAMELAQQLHELNDDRKSIERQMQKEAQAIVNNLLREVDGNQLPLAFCLFHQDWHQGVVGLVASKIKERYHRPVIAFAKVSDDGKLKGSGRSIEGLHLRDALDQVASENPQLLSKFGGHAMAAGLSLDESQLPAFKKAFLSVLEDLTDKSFFNREIWVDGQLGSSDLDIYQAQCLRDILPWGQQLPVPLFYGSFMVHDVKRLGDLHLKFVLSLEDDERRLEGLLFFAPSEILLQPSFKMIDAVYQLDINFFRNQQNLQLLIKQLSVK